MAASAFDATSLPKMGCGRRASWQLCDLKLKAEVEILALSSSLAFQGCHSAQDLRASRWNRQHIFNLRNNLMSQIPPAEWK